MPIDPSIPLSYKAPDSMQQLSSLLNIANTAQTLQQNQQKTQQGGIDLQERQAMQQVLSDPSSYTDDQGNFSLQKAQNSIMRVAPTTGPGYISKLAEAHTNALNANKALNSLTEDNRTQIGAALSSLPPNAPQDLVYKTVDALGAQFGGRLDPLIKIFKQGYQQALAQGGPQAADDYRLRSARSVLPQETQQNIASGGVTAVPTDKGTVLVQTKVGADTPQGGQVGQTLAPPNAVVQSSTGRTTIVNPGSGVSTEPAPSGATPPVNLPAGETPDTLKVWQGQRTKANLAAAQVPEEQFNNNQIIKLTKTANMGQAGAVGNILRGMTGRYAAAPDLFTTNGTVDLDKIDHFLALEQGTLAQRAGFNTDAAHTIAEHQSGSSNGTPEGTASIARTNRALATGIDLYNRGQENWIKANGNDVFKGRDWQQAWSHAVDFDALRMYDAAKNAKEDPDGVKAIAADLGGTGSERYKAALKKYDAMLNLIRSGGR